MPLKAPFPRYQKSGLIWFLTLPLVTSFSLWRFWLLSKGRKQPLFWHKNSAKETDHIRNRYSYIFVTFTRFKWLNCFYLFRPEGHVDVLFDSALANCAIDRAPSSNKHPEWAGRVNLSVWCWQADGADEVWKQKIIKYLSWHVSQCYWSNLDVLEYLKSYIWMHQNFAHQTML